nr:hypothetical protein [uncultured Roseateles sp.]
MATVPPSKPDPATDRPAAGTEAGGSAAFEPGSPLAETTLEYWAELDADYRQKCYEVIEAYYQNLLEHFLDNANGAVKDYTRYGRLGRRWRTALILLMGLLAVLNILATSWPDKWHFTTDDRGYISFAAAIYASLLAMLANLESFFNFSDKKTSTRESRELYLDAFREFEMLRLVHVYPFGFEAQACFNFSRLYRRLVVKDLELRRKILQLTETRASPAGAKV